ncbi:MAG: ChaN family lipoprotein [Candidatus Saccharicenans sp.]|uniref:ChaN family lipoprotein n=1 Tax=Candidatus Saccharicenans sp. TaxID=2819258 RepID=UPI004049F5F6
MKINLFWGKLRIRTRPLWLALSVLLFASLVYSQSTEDKSLTLSLGLKQYRGKFLLVESGQLYSARTGKSVTFERMIKDMKKARLIHIGETHDDLDMHNWQFRIIEALYKQDPALAIGLEQVTVDLQPVLDRWVSGELEEKEFLRAIRWYVTWNFNYGYYKKIFDLAREKKIPLFALNAPRNLISKVRMQGYEALTEEEKKIVAPLDLTNEEHRLLLKTIFESEEIPPQMKGANLEAMFEALYRAQVAWDETMGRNAVRAAEATGRRVVVLAGSGHMLYNLGLNYRASKMSGQPFITVIGVQVSENSRVKVSRGLADFIYGVREKEYPAYPAFSLNLKKVEGLTNLVVAANPSEPLAKAAGFQKGDVILAAGDQAFDDLNELRMFLANHNWGDEVQFRVLRNGEVIRLVVKLDPMLVKKKENQKE